MDKMAEAMIRQIETLVHQCQTQQKNIDENKKQKQDVEKKILAEQPAHARAKSQYEAQTQQFKARQTERVHLEAMVARMTEGNNGIKEEIGEQLAATNSMLELHRDEKSVFVREMMEMGNKIKEACNKPFLDEI